MSRKRLSVFLAAAALSAGLVVAPQRSAAQPDAAPATQAASGETPLLPEIRFDSIPLPDVLDLLRDTTGWNIVLMAQPGFDPAQIRVNLRLKNVTLEQLMELIRMTPGYQIDLDGDRAGKILLVKVGPAEGAPTQQMVSGTASLAGVLPPANDNPDNKKMTDEITALIDASIATLGDQAGPPPKVYFHPATRVVVYRGTEEQVNLLNSVFSTLYDSAKAAADEAAPKREAEFKQRLEQFERKLKDMADENASLARRLAESQAQLDRAERDLAQTRARLAGRQGGDAAPATRPN